MSDGAPSDGVPGHLAIGEVLALLQTEFPDVTISKIRFLEAQGLIVPERTAAGYRKFYDADIARLRWVLAQQRDNFLPLKVIKARLESGDLDSVGPVTSQPSLWGESDGVAAAAPPVRAVAPTDPADATDGTVATEPVERPPSWLEELVASSTTATPRAQLTATPDPGASIIEATASDVAEPAPSASASSEPAASSESPDIVPTSPNPDVSNPDVSNPDAPGMDAHPGSAGAASDRTPVGVDRPGDASVERIGEPAQRESPSWLAALQEPPTAAGQAEGVDSGDHNPAARRSGRCSGPSLGAAADESDLEPERNAGPAADDGEDGTLRYGREEIAELVGVSIAEVDEMVTFGLLQPLMVGGEPTFDRSSVAVARAVVRFGGRGVEPRHLRLFKNAADREAGFFEQLILPMLKQRNPAALDRARTSLIDLAAAGEDLHRALIDQALRPHLGR
ncbi:MAG: MerR family DNA-binding transcriptional regulator [Actinobacteria bacterium]|nr:MerR family DNA-binding transcriptional regulator [Actinomycetota bacterium]